MSLQGHNPNSDPMMDELRQIRDSISAQLLPLSLEDRLHWVQEQTARTLTESGYELRPHPTMPNCSPLVRKSSG